MYHAIPRNTWKLVLMYRRAGLPIASPLVSIKLDGITSALLDPGLSGKLRKAMGQNKKVIKQH